MIGGSPPGVSPPGTVPPGPPPPGTKIGSPPPGGNGTFAKLGGDVVPGEDGEEATGTPGTGGAKKSLGKPPGPTAPEVGTGPSGPTEAGRTDAIAVPGAGGSTAGPAAASGARRGGFALRATPPTRTPGERAANSASAALPPTADESPWGSPVASNSAATAMATEAPTAFRFPIMRPAGLGLAVIGLAFITLWLVNIINYIWFQQATKLL